ncbi:xylose isomerase-like TIM barrel protein [Streptomyces puniciscabiei]|uniref:Xylose isomerase-like TIM barrel protein n=1 Tax=Streptomyces puniciscabiei TaxID=164348 RepID=A0A542SXK1_9ACTN|nr:TIM barrel protein [Streptomyces puniciscabiei]TQK79335.1 xylose isomerase-like TIM barrel protein [Streptomyces puniciscabiei]
MSGARPQGAVTVAAPQWRIGTDRAAAARAALAAGADALHLDFGGAHRGPPLTDPAELAAAEAVARVVPVPVLAVNHVNDIGLALARGTANPAALVVLHRALDCARRLGVRVLHVPGFRRSLPTTAGLRAGTADALRTLCERAGAAGLTLAYESPLGPEDSLALARAVDHPALRLVLDTGNLLDAGVQPAAFARAVAASGLLLPDLHVKDPAGTAGWSGIGTELRCLLGLFTARSVLVENDYRQDHARLRADVAECRTALATGHETMEQRELL